MIVLSKKRLKFIFGVVVVSIISVGLTYNIQKEKSIETVALPVSNKVVVLDARTWQPR